MSTNAGAARPLTLSYETRSDLQVSAESAHLRLALSGGRGEVGLRGEVRDAALLRDALLTATAILGSDQRYKGKDRAAYLAYLAKKGKRASAAIWEAQKAFLDEALSEDRQTETPLDPLLTVDPDEVALEVFSRDESTYARLALSSDLFGARQAAHGTSFVDLSERLPALSEELDRLRGHSKLRLSAGVQAAGLGESAPARSGESPGPVSRPVELPHTWLRGFLQVQSAATLPGASCELLPIDVYNLLYALRTRKAKKSPRALRFELIPGAPPRLVLEPWELVLEGHGAPYQGPTRVVRTFGRQRLQVLGRLLPHLRKARVLLLGAGLPVFWVLDLGVATLTLGLSGWTEQGWGGVASFDALMPEDAEAAALLAARARDLLVQRGPLPLAEIRAALSGSLVPGQSDEALRAALKLLCLRGLALYDLHRGVFRPRQLLAQPIEDAAVRFGSPAEARAHRLLGKDGSAHKLPESEVPTPGQVSQVSQVAQQGDVRLMKIHEIAGEGVELSGQINDRDARRTFLPRFTLDLEGRAREASCGCPLFRRAGLREGPCEHLLALRLLYSRVRAREEALRKTPEGRRLIRAETRTLVRRDDGGAEQVYRVSLDDRVVKLVWGPRVATPTSGRQQRLWFDSDHEAREAYFQRLESLAQEGFIDAETALV